MEKTIFLFRRHKERNAEDFARHYIGNHAPLGARLTRVLLGYVVNIVDSGDGPDAVTEHWLPAAMDLLTPDKAYASREDFEAVVADDRTLFDGFDLYVVVEEIETLPADPLAVPLGTQTPERKRIVFYPDAAAVPPPPAGARRVVDNRVDRKLVFTSTGREAIAPDIALIRMIWGEDAAPDDGGAAPGLGVREYRFVAPPRWR